MNAALPLRRRPLDIVDFEQIAVPAPVDPAAAFTEYPVWLPAIIVARMWKEHPFTAARTRATHGEALSIERLLREVSGRDHSDQFPLRPAGRSAGAGAW